MKPVRPCGKVIYSSLIIGIVVILGVDSRLAQAGVEYEKNIKELREDINSLNLINGLNLTQHQIKHVLQYTEEVKSLKESYFKDNPTAQEMEKTFTELKTVLEKNQGIPFSELCRYIDGFTIALKGFDEKYFEKVCGSHITPVLEALKVIREERKWLEITTLIVPTYNDDMAKLRKMCQWIKTNLGTDVPLHFARFVPEYKLKNLPPTPIQTLEEARKIGQEEGIRFVYLSNVAPHEGNNTYCPNCKKDIVKRIGFKVLENNLEDGRCRYCKRLIPGVWT